ncbi:MAG: LysR family transcriptional regulator [Candidatus Coproplasma sp.]
MEINYLKEFVHLADVGNFLTAADDLFISQSSLSKHIKAIESELGTPLFNRTTRKVRLTEAGETFLIYAREIARQQAEYTKAINKILTKSDDVVSLGALPTMAQYDITDIVYTFQRKNPDMKLNLIMGDTYELKAKLDDGTIDMAFLRDTEQTDDYYRIFFHLDNLVAVVPVKHPLSSQDSIRLEQLKDQDLCVMAQNTMLYDLCDKVCKQAGFDMKVFYSGHHLTNIADFVTKGEAIALITEGQTKFMRNPHIKVLDIEPKVEMEINLCYKQSYKPTQAGRKFIETVNNFLIKRQNNV